MSAASSYTQDTVQRLYLASEALRYLAENMPEESGGLAFILGTIASTVQSCGETLDNAEPREHMRM